MTTTLIVVLFTTIVLGGGTLPLMKVTTQCSRRSQSPLTFFIQYLESKTSGGRNRRKRRKDITMSKTSEFGSAIDSEHLSELTEEEVGSPSFSSLYFKSKLFRLSTVSTRANLHKKDSCFGITNFSDLSSSESKQANIYFPAFNL